MAHILVVEDEALVALNLCDLLQEEGHTAFYASNGEGALAALERQHPDLVIVDYKMPVMNGGALAQAIREDARWRKTPVLMISSFRLAEAELAKFGVNGFIQKPWAPSYLVLTVNQMLGDTSRTAVKQPQH